jgi:hypothetical protein
MVVRVILNFALRRNPLRGKIQSDVPTPSLLVSKARVLNLIVFAKHCLKAILCGLCALGG